MPDSAIIADLLAAGKLKRHVPSLQEIRDILAVADRQLADADVRAVSADGRFTSAYGAALALATVAVAGAGYRVTHAAGHHRLTFRILPELMGEEHRKLATYLDACRRKRNVADYDRVGAVSIAETDALLATATEMRAEVVGWLRAHHPALLDADSES